MDGHLIKYKPVDAISRVTLNHVLFGRLSYRDYRGKKYTYYTPGMLHNIMFYRVANSKIFVLDIDKINMEELRIFGDVFSEEHTLDINIEDMETGEYHWKKISEDKGLDFRVKRTKNKRT